MLSNKQLRRKAYWVCANKKQNQKQRSLMDSGAWNCGDTADSSKSNVTASTISGSSSRSDVEESSTPPDSPININSSYRIIKLFLSTSTSSCDNTMVRRPSRCKSGRKVTFCRSVQVRLIPTRQELSVLSDFLYWSADDMIMAARESLAELQSMTAFRRCSMRQAASLLYQPDSDLDICQTPDHSLHVSPTSICSGAPGLYSPRPVHRTIKVCFGDQSTEDEYDGEGEGSHCGNESEEEFCDEDRNDDCENERGDIAMPLTPLSPQCPSHSPTRSGLWQLLNRFSSSAPGEP